MHYLTIEIAIAIITINDEHDMIMMMARHARIGQSGCWPKHFGHGRAAALETPVSEAAYKQNKIGKS